MAVPPLHPLSAWSETIHAPARVPPAILADKIDPQTLDYASLTEGYSIAEGVAVHALVVERGSGVSVREIGNRFREVRYVETENESLLRSFAEEAFRAPRTHGIAELVDVAVVTDAVDGSQQEIEVKFRDLVSGTSRKLRAPVARLL